jgi:2-polyprenyl-3-methyl-5-hydroxy-6-metoxy-1,4-benzoquinol methylase
MLYLVDVESSIRKINHMTVEKQYGRLIKIDEEFGREKLGLMSGGVWQEDPKRLGIVLSRYKFVGKMLQSKSHVLEVGCGDAFASRIVAQFCESLTVLDFDQIFIDDINNRKNSRWKMNAICADFIKNKSGEEYDGVYALDVIEHINASEEDLFFSQASKSLKSDGIAVFGTPSLESQVYASIQSKEGHVNCKTQEDWKNSLRKHFANVLCFSMNDEVLHTGFGAMSHYLLFVCIGKL